MPLRHNSDELHGTVTCRVPPREQWRRTPPRTCAQTCPSKCGHLHPKDQEKSTIQYGIGAVLLKPVAHTVGRTTATRRPTRRRSRDTTEEVVPEVGKHAHEDGSRLQSCREGREEVRGRRLFLLFFLFLLWPEEDEEEGAMLRVHHRDQAAASAAKSGKPWSSLALTACISFSYSSSSFTSIFFRLRFSRRRKETVVASTTSPPASDATTRRGPGAAT